MSNFKNYGTLTGNGSANAVSIRGWATLSAHLDSGSGTLTWEFKGPDGVWRSIYGGNAGDTEQAFTATHMINVYFGDDVNVRCTASLSTSPVWDWQIMSNPANRD